MDIVRKLKMSLASTGLTEEEIAFYVSILKKPGSTIFDAAKRAKISKDKAYKIYDTLEAKKLIISENASKQKRIRATNLNSFIEDLYKEGRKYYHTADNFKQVKPFLSLLGLPEQENNFRSVSQAELAESYVDLSYLNWEEVLAYGNFEICLPIMGTDPDHEFMTKRVKRGKQAFPILANPGEFSMQVARNDYKEMRHTKLIYDKKLDDYFVFIFPDINTTAIWLRDKDKKVSGAVIESQFIANLHEKLFAHFNEAAEKHNFSS